MELIESFGSPNDPNRSGNTMFYGNIRLSFCGVAGDYYVASDAGDNPAINNA